MAQVTLCRLVALALLARLGAEGWGFAQAPALQLDAANIGRSKAIPKVGDDVVFLVPVKNTADRATTAFCRLVGRATDESGRALELSAAELRMELQPGEARDVPMTWRPTETGFYDLAFELSDDRGGETTAGHWAELRQVAVVARDLYFAWFGAPKSFRWCNVPTTVAEKEVPYWLRRGAIPCAWRGGVCYREWSRERFVEHWGSSRWIAIDEIGGPGEDTTKFMSALREIKAAHPDHFVAVWFMGAHDYWADVRDIIDLFLPEVYLNYLGDHLGIFDGYLDATRRTGAISQTVFALGINVIEDEKTKLPRVVPTKDDVLRQVRYLKRIAPDMPGLGFFTSDSAPPGVAEYADELCGEYFVKPVITLVDHKLAVEAGKEWRARLTVGNCGGMTARDVRLRMGIASDGGLTSAQEQVIGVLASGEQREIAVSLAPCAGIVTVKAELQASPAYTLLEATAEEPVCFRGLFPPETQNAETIVYLPPWPEGERRDVPVWWPVPQASEGLRVIELDASGAPKTEMPSLELTSSAGKRLRWVVAGVTPAGRRRLFAVLPSKDTPTAPSDLIRCEREGDLLRIRTPHYRAELNLASDEIASLKPAGSDTELLKSPWAFACSTQPTPRPCEVTQSGDWVVVRVPVESPLAEGESRYVFSARTPAIEIARRFRPRSPIKITGAGERCSLEQRGGTFALQAGVGSQVVRGELRDSSAYRDLYFGYLGVAPSERNADQAGWLDFSWEERWNAGLGVVIAERWRDARSQEYDVTRLYDASDWLEVLHVWGTETTIEREQTSRIFLVPHGLLDMRETPTPPAQAVWETVHRPLRAVVGG